MNTNSESNLPVRHILLFGTVIVNEGQGYHQDDGVFTVPRNGKYIFSWTIATETGGFVSVEIVVDGRVVGSLFANGPYGWDFRTGVVIVQASAGNHVFIRMHQTGSGVIDSDAKGRSQFSGCLLF
uniref:EMILIN-2-like n=1 Tax=Crassostrea virginica TaxID=6565 RepID=A0A8B8BWQ1_CRAVI|nr:EMILIN-2-like [Crassostrea virginica]